MWEREGGGGREGGTEREMDRWERGWWARIMAMQGVKYLSVCARARACVCLCECALAPCARV